MEISVKNDIVKMSVMKAMIRNEMNEMRETDLFPNQRYSVGVLEDPERLD